MLIDIIRMTVAFVVGGISIVALLAIPYESIELSRWLVLFFVSKAVGIGGLFITFWLIGQHFKDVDKNRPNL